jgi:capsular polysaccharide biosynthesis protein
MLIGLGVYVASPHQYQASTRLLIALGPYEDANTVAVNNQNMAHSSAVAKLVVHKLGLQETPASFLSSYAATSVTNRVLIITVAAPSASQALQWANAVTSAFVQFRAEVLQNTQNLALDSLNQQIKDVQNSITSIEARINQLSAQPTSSEQQSELSSLKTQRSQADTILSNLQQAVVSDQANAQPAITAAAKGSIVLDAATLLPQSRLKHLILYVALGLVAGLSLGVGIVVVRALVSDRLRQRDDVAYALGAPVKLSVGLARPKRWLPGRHGLAAAHDIRRIAAHLGQAMPPRHRRAPAPALAIVPVDDQQVPALSLISLAVSCAEQGQRVLVTDLCSGAPAAKLLGVNDPGVRTVSGYDARLVVAVPERDEFAPAGPLRRGLAETDRASFADAVGAAYASADVLLTLATLDPAVGGEHLATWATDAVVIITAGRSTATKINAVGEMIRLSGVRTVSAVLVGADTTDETLGTLSVSRADHDTDLTEHSHSAASDLSFADEEVRGKNRSASGAPRNP